MDSFRRCLPWITRAPRDTGPQVPSGHAPEALQVGTGPVAQKRHISVLPADAHQIEAVTPWRTQRPQLNHTTPTFYDGIRIINDIFKPFRLVISC